MRARRGDGEALALGAARRRPGAAGGARRAPRGRVLADRRVRLDEAGEELGLQPLLRQQPLDPRRERERSGSTQHQLLLDAERQAAAEVIATDAWTGLPGGLPRVVRGARPEAVLVRDDARVAADLLRALRVPEQVRVVALLPDEDEMRGGHEVGDERAALAGHGNGSVRTQNQPAWSSTASSTHSRPARRAAPPPWSASPAAAPAIPRRKVRRMGSVTGGVCGHNVHMSERDVAIVLSGGGVNGVLLQLGFLSGCGELAVAAGRLHLRHFGGRADRDDGGARPARRARGVHARPSAARRLRAAAALAAAAERAPPLRPARDDGASGCSTRTSSRTRSPQRRSS